MQGRRILKYSFVIIIIIFLIMNLVLLVHTGFIQAQFGLLSSNAVCYNFAIQGIFSLLYHIKDTPLFFLTLGLHFHGPDHTQKTSPCKPTLVLLGRSVSQLSCSASFFFFFFLLFFFFSRTLTNYKGFL